MRALLKLSVVLIGLLVVVVTATAPATPTPSSSSNDIATAVVGGLALLVIVTAAVCGYIDGQGRDVCHLCTLKPSRNCGKKGCAVLNKTLPLDDKERQVHKETH